MNIQIEKLPRPENWGDWHDKPVKWQVVSVPANPLEVQKFTTRKEAELYRRIRLTTPSIRDAHNAYVNTI